MPKLDEAIAAAAFLLAARRATGQTGPRLPVALRPQSLAQAMAMQSAVSGVLAHAHGERVAGWKCGTPAPGKLVAAPLYASCVHEAASGAVCPAWSDEGLVRVEPELAFVIGRDLPPRAEPYTPAEVDAAIARTHLALELIDNRLCDTTEPSFAEKLADGLVNQGLFIGPQVDGALAAQAREMPIKLSVAGDDPRTLNGCHPDALPRLPLYWLAQYLSETGVGLQAGQVVITGSYAGCFGLPLERSISLQYGVSGELGELGELHVRFVDKPRL